MQDGYRVAGGLRYPPSADVAMFDFGDVRAYAYNQKIDALIGMTWTCDPPF